MMEQCRKKNIALAALACMACVLALSCSLLGKAWAAAGQGVYTATVAASYANPDTGAVEDAGGSSNATLGQSMVDGLVQRQALVENDGKQEYVTVRFGQLGLISNVRVAADANHDGSFDGEAECAVVQELADAKQADYRFTASDDAATFKFSVYVDPMGRDVTFFVKLADLAEGNAAGFVQSVSNASTQASAASEAKSAASSSASATASPSAASPSASASSASSAASSSAASPSAASSGSAAPSNGSADAAKSGANADGGLNMPLIIGIVVAAVVVIALVAYFAAIRPGKEASKKAAEEAERRERYKNS